MSKAVLASPDRMGTKGSNDADTLEQREHPWIRVRFYLIRAIHSMTSVDGPVISDIT